jgi:hypothetical protein
MVQCPPRRAVYTARMRRLVLNLLLVLLSMQWATAWAGPGCPHGDARHAHPVRHDPGHALGQAARGHDDHAVQASDTAPVAAAAHHGHPGRPGHARTDSEAALGGPPALADAAANPPQAGTDGCPLGDCDRCCQGSGTAPPAARTLPSTAALTAVPQPPIDLSPVSPALDGPFRPPRRAAA